MAKKDNTMLWLAALGIGGYLYWEHKKKQQTVSTSTTVTEGFTTTSQITDSKPVVALPPSSNLLTNQPVNASSASSAPSTMAVNTTGLVPATIKNNQPVLQPGQTLALNANNVPIVNANGVPLVFPAPVIDTLSATNMNNAQLRQALMSGGLDEHYTEVL